MKLLLLAGEESGAIYAQRIREQLLANDPGVEIRGYQDYGFEIADLAVIGFWAVLKKAFYFLRVKRTMERAIVEWRPDVVCTVDYPGMNLKLAAFAKKRQIRAVHVVCPQVWAWKKGRIPKIEAALDKLCCFFPFEPSFFREGFAEFVGHPLVDEFRGLAAGVNDKGKTLAILPGSRLGEISAHMPVLVKVMEKISSVMPIKVVIPAANDKAYAAISSVISSALLKQAAVSVIRGGARELLCHADAAIVASGTATLEAAIANCPTVLVYKVNWLFAAIMRRLIKGVRHLGLANIIAEKAGRECPMPECIQEDFTVENVLKYLRPYLEDEAANERKRAELKSSVALLGSGEDAISRIVRCLK